MPAMRQTWKSALHAVLVPNRALAVTIQSQVPIPLTPPSPEEREPPLDRLGQLTEW